jgi:hypothetical protein
LAGPASAADEPDKCKGKICNFALVVGVGFRNDNDPAGRTPKEWEVMRANAEALTPPLLDNWGFDKDQLQGNTILNKDATKQTIKAGFQELLAKVRGIRTSCEMSTVLMHFQGHMARPLTGNNVPDLMVPKAPDANNHPAFRTYDQATKDGYDHNPDASKGFVWDFEVKDQVTKLLSEYQALNKIRTGAGKPAVKFNVVVEMDGCYAEEFLNDLINTPNVSLAWSTGKNCKLTLEGKKVATDWVVGFTSAFNDAEGVTDPTKNVTVDDAHKAASELVNTKGKASDTPADLGADYSPHGQSWNPNPHP